MKKLCGFTLIEMMVVIAIAAILFTIAIPSYQTTIRKNRIEAQAADLMGAFNSARMEAIRRSSPVTICSSTDQANCDGAGGTDWSVGWIIVDDLSNELIRVHKALHSMLILTTVAADSVTYQSDSTRGRNPAPPPERPPPVIMTLKADNCGNNEKRDITISAIGQISIVESDCP